MLTRSKITALFDLGDVHVTPGAGVVLQESGESHAPYIARHLMGDWGEMVNAGDAAVNDMAVRGAGRLLSAYMTDRGMEIWVVTSWNRGRTVVMLPEEYDMDPI